MSPFILAMILLNYGAVNCTASPEPQPWYEYENGSEDDVDFYNVQLFDQSTSTGRPERSTAGPGSIFTIKTPSSSMNTEIKPIASQHVLFEPVGRMVGTVSYVHLLVDLQYHQLIQAIQHYNDTVNKILHNFRIELPAGQRKYSKGQQSKLKIKSQLSKQELQMIQSHPNASQAITFLDVVDIIDSLSSHRETIDRKANGRQDMNPSPYAKLLEVEKDGIVEMEEQMKRLDIIVPAPKPENLIDPTQNKTPSRQKRALLGGIVLGGILGLTGTLLGGFNQRDINRLASRMSDVEKKQQEIVEVLTLQDAEIQNMDEEIRHLGEAVEILFRLNPGAMHAQLSHKRDRLNTRLNQILEAVKQAELHRLSPGAMTAFEIEEAFNLLEAKAQEMDMELVPGEPGHLFQLETSLLRREENRISLLVHVPMAKPDHVYKLYHYHPMPVVYEKDVTFIVDGQDDLLAVGPDRSHSTLSQVSLDQCQKLADLYICHNRAVTFTQENATCLGSLYYMHEAGVKEHCPIRSAIGKEVAYQINANAFIVYVPVPLASYIDCGVRNRSYSQVFGHARITLGPNCECHLRQHRLRIGSNIKVQAAVSHFTWDWNPLAGIDGLDREELYNGFVAHNHNNPGGVLVHELVRKLQNSKPDHFNVYRYYYLITGLAVAGITFLALFLGIFYISRIRRGLQWLHQQLQAPPEQEEG